MYPLCFKKCLLQMKALIFCQRSMLPDQVKNKYKKNVLGENSRVNKLSTFDHENFLIAHCFGKASPLTLKKNTA